MIDEARRAEVADGLRQLLGTSATCIVPYREVVEEFVRRLMDAVKAEIRAEMAPQVDAARPEPQATPAPKRDFGTHLCLCDYQHTRDGKTCIQCHGTLAPLSPGPAAGSGLKPAYQMSEHGE